MDETALFICNCTSKLIKGESINRKPYYSNKNSVTITKIDDTQTNDNMITLLRKKISIGNIFIGTILGIVLTLSTIVIHVLDPFDSRSSIIDSNVNVMTKSNNIDHNNNY
jgi:cell division protein FtsL